MTTLDSGNKTPTNIEEIIFNVVAEVCGRSITELKPELSIADDLAPSSIERITLFMALEDEFGGSIEENEVVDLVSLKDLVQFIEAKVTERGSP
jgi:acyl carrier protein